MKKSGKLVTGLLGLAMAAVTVLPAMALSSSLTNQVVDIPRNQVWAYGGMVSHTPSNQGALVRCESVFPIDGRFDDFQYIRCRITDYRGTVVSEETDKKIKEGTFGYESMRIREEYANVMSAIYFQFRGNSNAPAKALVSFKGNW